MGSLATQEKKGIRPLDAEEFRELGHQMVDFLADYFTNIENYPVRSQVQPGYLQPLLPDCAPEEPEQYEDVMADVQSKIMPGVTHWQSPNFFAYYPANTSTAGILGELLCGGLNTVGFSWISSPAATELEMIVLNWLAKVLNLPPIFLSPGPGGGVLQGTSSEALLVTVLAARNKFVDKLSTGSTSPAKVLECLVVYASDQAHSMIVKGSRIAGIHPDNIRILPTSAAENYVLHPHALEKAIKEDIAVGLVPFFLCATVGTTSSAAVDPLPELGLIAEEHAMWFHVDAAYAGSACICPEYQHYLEGLNKADSFSMNAHKWLLTTFDCCCLWVKEYQSLVAALSTNPEFLRNQASDAKLVVDYKDWQVPLGRRFRALKLWMILRLHGVSGLRSYIRNHVEFAKQVEELVCQDSRFEMVVPRVLSLVCFRLKPLPEDRDNGYNLNSTLLEAINSKGNLFLTHTVLSGVYTLRMAIGATLTELKHVNAAWAALSDEAGSILAGARTRLDSNEIS